MLVPLDVSSLALRGAALSGDAVGLKPMAYRR
jgi:hypothetical protein